MESQLVSLSKIFTERLFRIPDYQRGYAWLDKQLDEFWLDLDQLHIDRNHYTGVLTLEEVPEEVVGNWIQDEWIIKAKGYSPFYVVDGQQRITTAIILIQAIIEHPNAGSTLNYTEINDIRKKFIFDSKDFGISRSYIFGYEEKDPSYQYLKANIFGDSVSGPIHETVYTQNLERSKKFFKNKIVNFTKEDLELLYRKVTQNLMFNTFSISDDVDVCVAFETMNNRGKPLSYLELLKNRLIYLSTKFEDEKYERNTLRDSINACWRSIYHNLGRNKSAPLDDDIFLWTHYSVYFAKPDEDASERRYRRFSPRRLHTGALLEKMFTSKNVGVKADPRSKITLQSVYDYTRSLQESIETWYFMFNPFDSNYDEDTKIWLDRLNRLNSENFYSLILVFLRKVDDPQLRVAFLQAVERNEFLATMLHSSYVYSGDYIEYGEEVSSVKLAVRLSKGEITPDKVIKTLSERAHQIATSGAYNRTLLDMAKRRSAYSWKAIRYILFEYNSELEKMSKTKRPKIAWTEFTEHSDDYITIEHIYPQHARHEYWVTRFSEWQARQKAALRNSIGNLLPLSRPKNSSLSNKPFPEKVSGQANATIGYRFGSYAENEVGALSDWNADEIIKRGFRLLRFMEKRWGMSFHDLEYRLSVLGLDFLDRAYAERLQEAVISQSVIERRPKRLRDQATL